MYCLTLLNTARRYPLLQAQLQTKLRLWVFNQALVVLVFTVSSKEDNHTPEFLCSSRLPQQFALCFRRITTIWSWRNLRKCFTIRSKSLFVKLCQEDLLVGTSFLFSMLVYGHWFNRPMDYFSVFSDPTCSLVFEIWKDTIRYLAVSCEVYLLNVPFPARWLQWAKLPMHC